MTSPPSSRPTPTPSPEPIERIAVNVFLCLYPSRPMAFVIVRGLPPDVPYAALLGGMPVHPPADGGRRCVQVSAGHDHFLASLRVPNFVSAFARSYSGMVTQEYSSSVGGHNDDRGLSTSSRQVSRGGGCGAGSACGLQAVQVLARFTPGVVFSGY